MRSTALVFTPSSKYAGSLGPQIPHDLPYGLHLQLQAFGARGSLGIERFVELRQHHVFETSEIVA